MRRRLLMLLLRQNFRCHWCGLRMHPPRHPDRRRHGTIDHVVPRSKGGTDTRDNRVAACFACNQAKADKLPAEWSPPLPVRARAALAYAAVPLLSGESRR